MALNKTEYVTFRGKAYWAKLFEADDFRGASRWTLDLVMDDEKMWDKYKKIGIQKKVVDKGNGQQFPAQRATSKLMKGNMVYFTPPWIYDKDGTVLVKYVDEDGKDLRSYNEKDKKVVRIGDQMSIGNGSEVEVTLSVYQTAMGVGNRLESVKLIDVIEYVRPETPSEVARGLELDDEIPF